MAAHRLLAEEAPFAAARAAVEDAQLRSDELRFSELQPRSYHEAAQLQAVRQKIQRLRVQAAGAYHQDPDIYGDDGAWLGLRGSCFDSPPLTEKSVLGGTSNVVARAYVFRVCPFKNVTQREADHLEWKRATAKAEGKKLKRSKAVWKSTSGVGPNAVTPSSRRRVDGVGGAVKFDFYTGPRRPNLLSWASSRSGL